MKHKTWISICLAASLFVHLTLPAFAADPAVGALADLDVSIGAGAVTWSYPGTGGGMVTITGSAGFRTDIPFDEGGTPTFLPAETQGELADGTYRWEIVLDGVGRSSGAFTLRGGSLASPARIEGGMEKAEVILDDLIIDGHACFGVDCEDDEVFEFDTVRLKENNIRIAFDDTSTQSSFPSNDWELVANDVENGGANYFSIRDDTADTVPFTIAAGASSQSLYVDAIGVGLGTSTPARDLHVVDGSAPALRLEQDVSGGLAAQTWDVAGDGAGLRIEDSTAGTTPFQIEAGAREAAMVVTAEGEIGLGTSNPKESLHIKSDGTARVRFEHGNGEVWSAGAHSASFVITRPNSSGNELEIRNSGDVIFRFGGLELARIDKNGNLTTAGTVNGTSDVHRKRDFAVADTAAVLARVASLPITSWSYKADDPGVRHLGPMAQDFHAAFGLGIDERHIAASDLAGVALAAIQELNDENAALTARLADLEALVGGLLAD